MTVNEWAEDFKSFVNELQMPRDDYNGIMEYIDDAIALLKEQEPVKAVADGDSYICSNCGTVIGWVELYPGGVEEVKHKFCNECGRAVKWE